MNKKVLLIAVNGSYSHKNLAVRCLRRTLEAEGFTVEIAEYNLHDRTAHILERLCSSDASIYGFSVYIWNTDLFDELARELKKLKPSAKIIMGGPEVSYETERFKDRDYIDCIVSGEGEDAVVSMCKYISEGSEVPKVYFAPPAANVMGSEGILYRDDEVTAGSLLYYESSRGCPFNCAYCLSSATHGVRYKSVEQVAADMREFEKFAGRCKTVKFVDRTFNSDPHRACEIWRMLSSDEFTLKYHFEVCSSLLDDECFEVLSKMPKGKIQLEVGLQSTNKETLAAVSRHLDPAKVISASKRILDFGNMNIYLDLIAGLPYENLESFGKSFDDAYFACSRLQVGFLKLLPGTALRRDAKKYGFIYTDKAPYTVMQSDWLSFEDMSVIRHVHELLERYCESGKFEKSLHFIYRRIDSPFAFWRGFYEYIAANDGRDVQKLSQPAAYNLLGEYAGVDKAGLYECLREDFTVSEHKNPPGSLMKY